MSNINFERPILFFSEYCIHSENFLNILVKYPEIYDSFIRVNIDVNPSTKKRPSIFYQVQQKLNFKISEVPTIIINNAEYILSGTNAFDWLEDYTKSIQQKHQDETAQKVEDELIPFNPNEMGSFSDSYSTLGSNDLNNAKEQCFKFIGKEDDKINTPQESENISKDNYNEKQKERERFDNVQTNHKPQLNVNISKQLQGSLSNKQDDFDSKLQQMISDRQGVLVKPMKNKSVNFQTGDY